MTQGNSLSPEAQSMLAFSRAASALQPAQAPVSLSDERRQSLQTASDNAVASLEEMSQARRLMLGGEDSTRRLATAVFGGFEAGQDPLVQQLAQGSLVDLTRRYGSDNELLTGILGFHRMINSVARQDQRTPTVGEHISDAAVNAFASGSQMVGGILSMGAGLLSDDLGARVAQSNAEEVAGYREHLSQAAKDEARAAAIRAGLRQEEIDAQYQRDVVAGDPNAGLFRFGREVYGAAADLVQNPERLSTLAGDGIGSIAASGGIGGVVRMAAAKVITPLVAQSIGMGAMEAGSVYAQIQGEIQRMSEEELSSAPEYQSLRASGMTHEQARNRIANVAGLEGGAIQGVAGTIIGRIAARFEANPLHVGSTSFRGALREAGGDAVREATEEALQEGSGQLVQNMAIERNARPGMDIGSGIGGAMVEGAVGGALSAGTMQAPDVALRGAVSGARAALDGAQTVVEARREANDRRLDAVSPTGSAAVSEATVRIEEALRNLTAADTTPVAEGEDTQTPQDQTQERVRSSFEDTIEIRGPEINEMPSTIRGMFSDGGEFDNDFVHRRMPIVQEVLNELGQDGLSEQDRVNAALWAVEQMRRLSDVRNQDLSSYHDAVRNDIQTMFDSIDVIQSSELMRRAQTIIQNADLSTVKLTDENIDTEAGREAIAQTILIAQVDPMRADPDNIRSILHHRKIGNTAIQQRILDDLSAATAFIDPARQAEAEKAKIKQTSGRAYTPSQVVREGLSKRGRDLDRGQLSMLGHHQQINEAMRNGDITRAQVALDRLRNFAEHMLNKVEAARASAALNRNKDNKIPYRTWTGQEWLDANHEGASSVFLAPQSERGKAFAQDVVIDAQAVSTFYNNLLTVFGDRLKGDALPQVKPIDLPQGTASEVTSPREVAVAVPESTTDTAIEAVNEQSVEERAAEAKAREEEVGAREETPADITEETRVEETQGDTEAKGAEDSTEGAPRDGSTETTSEPAGDVDGTSEGDATPEVETVSFPTLVTAPGEVSRVRRAYEFFPSASELIAAKSPMQAVVEKFRDLLAGKVELDEPLTYSLDRDRMVNLIKLMRGFVKETSEVLNRRLQEPLHNKKTKTSDEWIRESVEGDATQDIFSINSLKVTNLVDAETGRYHQGLLETALIATFDWLQSQDGGKKIDREKARELLGESEYYITAEMLHSLNNGLPAGMAIESLAKTILEYWGAKTDRSVSMSDTRGIVEGLAAEILLAVASPSLDMVKIVSVKRLKGDRRSDPTAVEFNFKRQRSIRKQAGAMVSLVADTMVHEVDNTSVARLDSPFTEKQRRQRRNLFGFLSKRVERAIEMHRQVEFRRNTPYVALMKAIGREGYLDLMGYEHADPENTNVNHLATVEGRNMNLARAFDMTLEHDEKVVSKAKSTDRTPEEVRTFFDWYQGSNGRLMAKGFNGQADKTMREAYTATNAILDMTSEIGQAAFWVTIAQAVGVKTELSTRSTNIEEARKRIEELFGESIDNLQLWMMESEDGTLEIEMPADIRETLRREMRLAGGGKGAAKMLHAVLAVARLRAAETRAYEGEPGALTNFQHSLSLEADGKTDGPINAMMNFVIGQFTPREFELLRKGGFFPNTYDRTLGQHFNTDKEGDLYQTAATDFEKRISDFLNDSDKSKNQKEDLKALLRILSKLAPKELSFDGQTVKVGRNFLKNPLTVVVYGSSKNGIAGKVADNIADAFSVKITEMMRGEVPDTQLLEDMQRVVGRAWVKDEIKGFYEEFTSSNTIAQEVLKDPKNFEFNQKQYELLQRKIKKLLIVSMEESIQSIMGISLQVLGSVQTATQVQGAFLNARFKGAVKEVLKEARASGEIGQKEYLSEKLYNNVFKRLEPLGVVVEGISGSTLDANHVNLSRPEREINDTLVFAHALDGSLRPRAGMQIPGSVGVSASPMLTISRGDAEMMIRYYASTDPSLKTLQVYDGLEIAADEIEAVSRGINASLIEAWLENPLTDVADSFENFLRQDIFKGIDLEELSKELSRPLQLPEGEVLTQSEVEGFLQDIRHTLRTQAIQAQARKDVLKEWGFSSDHMASGEAPANHQGRIEEGVTDEVLAQKMNDRFKALLAERAAEEHSPVLSGIRDADGGYVNSIEAKGETVGDVMVTTAGQVLNALTDAKDSLSKEHANALKAIGPLISDYQVIYATKEAANEHWQKTHPGSDIQIDMGLTDTGAKVIYLTNKTPETALHELMHAALAEIMHKLNTDPDSLSQMEKDAVANLESLLAEFDRLTFLEEADHAAASANALKTELAMIREAGSPTMRGDLLMEFVSWSLTNQRLAQALSRTKVQKPSRLRVLVGNVLTGLRRLLGLPRGTSLSIYSNVLWNSAALMASGREQPNRESTATSIVHQRLPSYRLRDLADEFDSKVGMRMRRVPVLQRFTANVEMRDRVNQAVNRVALAGVNMTPEETSLFRSLHASFVVDARMHGPSLLKVQKLYENVVKNLSVEDLMNDPAVNDPGDYHMADELYGLVTGRTLGPKDRRDRTMYIPSFLALAQINPRLRRALSKMSLPASEKVMWGSADEFFSSAGSAAMDRLSDAMSRAEGGNTGAYIDGLVQELARVEDDNRTFLETEAMQRMDWADTKGRAGLKWLADKLEDFSQGQKRNMMETGARGSAALLSALIDRDKGKTLSNVVVSTLNRSGDRFRAFRELVNEVIGQTDNNKGVLGLVNVVKYQISALRQEYREQLPKTIAEQFTRKLSDTEWSDIHLVFGKTDLAALRKGRTANQVFDLVRDASKLATEVAKFEAALSKSSSVAPEQIQAAKELADFMVTGRFPDRSANFLSNAQAIAQMLARRTGIQRAAVNDLASDPTIVGTIDQLTSLYALQRADKASVKKLQDLLLNESRGLTFTLHYLESLREQENQKKNGTIAELNSYKGYIPSESRQGTKLIVANDIKHNELVLQGWTRIGDYLSVSREPGKFGYYFTNVAGSGTYQQGAMQTVQHTVGGVNRRTGKTVTGHTAGMINDVVAKRLAADVNSGVTLVRGQAVRPVFGRKGDIVGFERTMSPDMTAKVMRNNHMAEMMGAWAGRIEEEQLATDFNKTLVDRVADQWFNREPGSDHEFVNIADPNIKDEIAKDSWDMIPLETKDYIESVFAFGTGDTFFPVRKDILNNALGYRAPSVTDTWTGMSRWSDENQKRFNNLARFFLGNSAFTTLATAEKYWQAGISIAKNTIVIRSVIVPLSNLASNVVQLATLGVPLRQIFSGMPKKLLEIDQHLKNIKRKVELEAHLAAAVGQRDTGRQVKLKAQISALDESSRRMSIWPLIEAGEFSTISEGLTDADAAITSSKFGEWMSKASERIPAQFGTAGRYFALTKDTALFQGMSRAVMYGDFLAKAVLFDHLREHEKLTRKEAIDRITEEFVNYNFLPGRNRSYAESMGGTWFWNYKLRILKVAHRTMRDRPARALLGMLASPLVPDVMGVSVGTPFQDNFLSVTADGRLPYSMGTGMLFHAPDLNPWINMTS